MAGWYVFQLGPRVDASARPKHSLLLHGAENEAVTDLLPLTNSAQELLLLLQSPLKPAAVEPASGVAVSVTFVDEVKVTEQAVPPLPQSMPAGLEVTLPVPRPERLTRKVFELFQVLGSVHDHPGC
jgi:hypothetical protein